MEAVLGTASPEDLARGAENGLAAPAAFEGDALEQVRDGLAGVDRVDSGWAGPQPCSLNHGAARASVAETVSDVLGCVRLAVGQPGVVVAGRG